MRDDGNGNKSKKDFYDVNFHILIIYVRRISSKNGHALYK